MKTNSIAKIVVSVAATLLLTGCGVNAENTTPTTELAETTEPTTVSASWVETPEVEGSAGFKMGDAAWIVLHTDDMAPASTHSEIVIAEINGYLITSPDYCETDMEELMWELIIRSDDGQACLNIWPIGDCYFDYEAANAVVESEMG